MNDFRVTFIYKTNGNIISKDIDIGLIQDVGTKINPKSTSTGIPTQPSQNSFIFDYGVTRTYDFSYRRVCPKNPIDNLAVDSTKWSNGFWVYIMKHYVVNRWQTETDGCKIKFTSPDTKYYPSIQPTNVYVSGFTSNQSAGDIYTLSGSIKFTVGGASQVKDVAEHVIVYDSNFPAQSNNVNAQSDDSNFLTVTNRDFINAMEVSGRWLELAQQYGIYQQGDNLSEMKEYFRWNTKSDGTGDAYTNYDLIDNLPEGTLTLYARYNRINPD